MIYLLLLILVSIFLAVNIRYKQTNYYKNEFGYLSKFKKMPSEMEIVNIGSSYAFYGLDLNYKGHTAMNLACRPQSFSYDLKILKRYANKISKGAVVLIPTCLFSFCVDEYEAWRKDIFDKYYLFLPRKYIQNYSWFRYIGNNFFPLLIHPRRIKYLFKDVDELDLRREKFNIEDVHASVKTRIRMWEREFGVEHLCECSQKKELLFKMKNVQSIVGEIIEFCSSNGWKPIVIIMPVCKEMKRAIGEKTITECLYNNVAQCVQETTIILDFLRSGNFDDSSLYIGADLLNATGRERLGNAIIDELEKKQYV